MGVSRRRRLLGMCVLSSLLGISIGVVLSFANNNQVLANHCPHTFVGLTDNDDIWDDEQDKKKTIQARDGWDYVRAEDCADFLYGEQKGDNLRAGQGDDYIEGGSGGEHHQNCVPGGGYCGEIHGGDGDDGIHGNEGNDVMYDLDPTDTDYFGGGLDDDSIIAIDDDGRDDLHGEGGFDACNKDAGDTRQGCEN
jgi:hypothetical protein